MTDDEIHAAMTADKGDDWKLADWCSLFERAGDLDALMIGAGEAFREAMHDRDRYQAERDAWRDQCQWRTIDTAPKDGTEFVMFDANVNTATVGCWMQDVGWRNAAKLPGEYHAKPSWFPLAAPTHWMPLPTPPEPDHAPDTLTDNIAEGDSIYLFGPPPA